MAKKKIYERKASPELLNAFQGGGKDSDSVDIDSLSDMAHEAISAMPDEQKGQFLMMYTLAGSGVTPEEYERFYQVFQASGMLAQGLFGEEEDDDLLRNRVRGSIVCGACGDALGYAIEFVAPYKQIEAIYGEGGIREYDLRYPWLGEKEGVALVSDDTQMTLYTAEGLLEAVRTDQEIIPLIRDAYLVWYAGQTGYEVNVCYDSELGHIPELNQRRAPGNTCLSALSEVSRGRWPENSSKGCGGIMRVAPLGLYGAVHGWSRGEIARIAGDVAELTHLHPLSTYSSAALAVIVGLCATAESIEPYSFRQIISESIDSVIDVYGADAKYMKEFVDCIRKALAFIPDQRPDWEVIEDSLGGGWVAEETLAIALFSVLRHFDDVEECLISAVNHGGDSDSTGAVAGNIIGAIKGYEAIPAKFADKVQYKDLLLRISDRLAE